jgi:putative RNA 2'-phosphotransferase
MAQDSQISKTLSYWLRHRPDAAGLTLSPDGWGDVDLILAALAQESLPADWERLLHVVETNDKTRFELSADGSRIRARQGHSVAVEAAWSAAQPPVHLYHGTVERFMPAIEADGLKRMRRHHVHLSPDEETARRVGSRRGVPVVLRVEAQALGEAGAPFFVTSNGVWLVDHVPARYIARLP